MVEFLAACVVAGTPLVFATVGELITEKTGNMNLGVEGMMLMGAVMGFYTGLNTASPMAALLAAALAGAGGALIYAFVTVTLKANQVVTGLTLTIFGTGFAQFVGEPLLGSVCDYFLFQQGNDPCFGADSPYRADLFPARSVRVFELRGMRRSGGVYV